MNGADFVSLVGKMRFYQKRYYRTRSRYSLTKSKALEEQVDEALSGQQAIFDDEKGGE